MKYRAAKNIAVMAVMAAILVGGKFAIFFIPNVEIVTPFIIIFTCVFGFRRTIFSVLVFCLLDNFLYPFYLPVTVQYFFHWPLLCILTAAIFRAFKPNELAMALFSVFMNILFWIETPALETFFGISVFFPRFVSGIPFMVIMALSGFMLTYFGFKPLYNLLVRIRDKAV